VPFGILLTSCLDPPNFRTLWVCFRTFARRANRTPITPREVSVAKKAPAKTAKTPAKTPVKAPAKPVSKPPAKAVAPVKGSKPSPKPAPKGKPEPAAKAKPTAPAAAKAGKTADNGVASKSKGAAPKVAAKPAPEAKTPAPAPAATAVDPKKPLRKGITIVSQKPMRKPKTPASTVSSMPAGLGRLLDPKGPARKPLIPSGPKASSQRPLGQHGGGGVDVPRPTAKTPFNKKELERYRQLLLNKRAELAGDVSGLEKEALRGEGGSLASMPSHPADAGSESYDQTLSLDLAAADRKLIREIDDALQRIMDGTFGICELTGKPIKLERLEELPWARHSIEAARELERQSMRS